MTDMITWAQVQANIQRGQTYTDSYQQTGATYFGYRADCSGTTSCNNGLTPSGEAAPSTFELVHNGYTILIGTRAEALVGDLVMVTNEDGHPFGHVAQIIAINRATDQFQIVEFGGSEKTGIITPAIRWLPSGLNYDWPGRNFQIYRLKNLIQPSTNSVTVDPKDTHNLLEEIMALPGTPAGATYQSVMADIRGAAYAGIKAYVTSGEGNVAIGKVVRGAASAELGPAINEIRRELGVLLGNVAPGAGEESIEQQVKDATK